MILHRSIVNIRIVRAMTLALVSAIFLPNLAAAQTQRAGNDNARVMQQLQQMTAERSKLQQDNAAMKKELEELQAKYAKTSADQAALQQRARELEVTSTRQQSASKDTTDALERSRTQLQELIGKFRETAATLQSVETDRDQVKAKLTAREREFKSCVDRNAGLYFLNDEILRRLEDHSMWSSLKEKEPFTKISRTRLENLIDDYRDRVEELRIAKQSTAAR